MAENILGNFIRAQLYFRDINKTEFAKRANISQSTISRIIAGKILNPDIETLIGLARASDIDICTMIALIRPDAFQPRTKANLIAAWIDRLPDAQRKIVDLVLSEAFVQGDDKQE